MAHDIFNPPNETPADRAWRLELTTIARLLCTRPGTRRAVKLDSAFPLYRIEDRANDAPLAFVAFQAIEKDYSPENPAPARFDQLRETSRQAGLKQLTPFFLCHWRNNHWGFAKIPDYFSIEERIPKAKNNADIALIPLKSFLALYQYDKEKSIKIET
jgi:hypothetical protein